MKLPVSENFADFRVMLNNFLVSTVIFLLPIGEDSLPILPGTECSLIRKFLAKFQNIAYFSGFFVK